MTVMDDVSERLPYVWAGKNWVNMESAWDSMLRTAYEGEPRGRAYDIRNGNVREINPVIVEVSTGRMHLFISPTTGEMTLEQTKYHPEGTAKLKQKILPGYVTYLTDGKKYYGVEWDNDGEGKIVTPYNTQRVPNGTWTLLKDMADKVKVHKPWGGEHPVAIVTHGGDRYIRLYPLRTLWWEKVEQREQEVKRVAREKLRERVKNMRVKSHYSQTTTLEQWIR